MKQQYIKYLFLFFLSFTINLTAQSIESNDSSLLKPNKWSVGGAFHIAPFENYPALGFSVSTMYALKKYSLGADAIRRLTLAQGFLPFRNCRLPGFGIKAFMVKLDVNLSRSQKLDRDWMNEKTACKKTVTHPLMRALRLSIRSSKLAGIVFRVRRLSFAFNSFHLDFLTTS
jgi:hypothetical protein